MIKMAKEKSKVKVYASVGRIIFSYKQQDIEGHKIMIKGTGDEAYKLIASNYPITVEIMDKKLKSLNLRIPEMNSGESKGLEKAIHQ
jgi:hypothetical protein